MLRSPSSTPAAQTNTVTLSTAGANGKVITDAVAFVKIEDNVAPDLKRPGRVRSP